MHAWGQEITVRALSGGDRIDLYDAVLANQREVEDWEADQAKDEEARQGHPKAELFDFATLEMIWAIHDSAGERIFTLEDHDRFRDLDYATQAAVYNAIVELRTPLPNLDTLKKSSS